MPAGPDLRYEEGVSGVFLSGDVQLVAKTLRVTVGGLYLLYGQFALTCSAPPCAPGTVTLQLRRQRPPPEPPRPLLAVPLALPGGAGDGPVRSPLAQAVGRLRAGDVLSLTMVAGEVAADGWQLDQGDREGNFVGLLRIAGDDGASGAA